MADSFEDPVFGTPHISGDHPRYRDWVAVCRRAAEEDAELRARLVDGRRCVQCRSRRLPSYAVTIALDSLFAY